MEALKKVKRPIEREFDILHNELDTLLKDRPVNEAKINATFSLFQEQFEKLLPVYEKMLEQVRIDDVAEKEEDEVNDGIRDYKRKAATIKERKEKLIPPRQLFNDSLNASLNSNGEPRVRNFKLQKVQVKKFNGKLTDWLRFWTQFKHIDEDAFMTNGEKCWHLVESIEPGNEAYALATAYPATDENYPLILGDLKRRYANEDVLVQVYMRELLNMVVSKVSSDKKIPLKEMQLKAKSHLRALRSLNLKNTDPESWLYPLFESTLEDDVLRAWERSTLSKLRHDDENDDEGFLKTRLDRLMEFVDREVEILDKLELAKSFSKEKGKEEKSKPTSSKSQNRTWINKTKPAYTLSSLHAGNTEVCVFCEKGPHKSAACRIAKYRMSYNDKITILRTKGRCFLCTGKHHQSKCDGNVRCQLCPGYEKHLTVLCKNWKPSNNQGNTPPAKKLRKDEGKTVNVSSNLECISEVALQTLMAAIETGGPPDQIRIFVDTGSQRSYLLNTAIKRLKLKSVGHEKVRHSLFGGRVTRVMTHQIYRIRLRSIETGTIISLIVRDHPQLCGNIPAIIHSNPEIVDELKLRGVTLSDDGSIDQVDLLIGADMYPLIQMNESFALRCGASAIRTRLGWSVLGQTRGTSLEASMTYSYLTMSSVDAQLPTYLAMYSADAQITKLWELEAIGICDPFPQKTEDEKKIIDHFTQNITRSANGRYSVRLPWRTKERCLPSNRDIALKRLEKTTAKLIGENLYDDYDRILKEWEREGFIEKVPVPKTDALTHYVSHRHVKKPDSLTTKVRPVFDASCRSGRFPSLNDLFIKGENYVILIPSLLLKFRKKLIAFIADIRKAFQMIGVHVDDRDVMRFLWWLEKGSWEIVEYRHTRVMFGATCSPFILGAVLLFHLTHLPKEEMEIGRNILTSLYVDNLVRSEDTVTEYKEFRESSVNILRRAQMDLRMWFSNVDEFDDPTTYTVSVLGLEWDRRQDELYLNIKGIQKPNRVTKRTVLSTVSKIYDPIGFSCPATLPMKLLLQRAWIQRYSWDEELHENDKREFLQWMEDLPSLGDIRISRLATAGVSSTEGWSFHNFNDASDEAYAASVFLRVETEGIVVVHLLAAKARVAPVKVPKEKTEIPVIKPKSKKSRKRSKKILKEGIERLSIPKLELMGCKIGVQLTKSAREALEAEEVPVYYWSDSTTALAWIKRQNQWGTFVANRVKEIRKLSNPDQWRHVPGSMNPADLPSRGRSPSQLLQSKWWEGPDWLYQPMSEWPSHTPEANEEEINEEEMNVVQGCVALSVISRVRREHSYFTLVKITAWAQRFIFNKFTKEIDQKRTGDLTETEIMTAEFAMVRNIQEEEFGEKYRKRLGGLEVLKDDWGVLRVKTRLSYRQDCESFKFPMILPGGRQEVRRLILDEHRKNCHAGTGILMTILREKYWILKARKSVKSVLKTCFRCRRFAAKQAIPIPAPLPLDRVNDVEVFENIGVDLAGPLFLRDDSKVWIVIFTCAVYRAVHFEIVDSISATAFIEALEKFSRKYRRPAIIYADNGTNFRGSNTAFCKLNWERIKKTNEVKQIQFKFIPAMSPWYGGWWERLIRSAKDLLKRTVGKATLNLMELESVVRSVAETMNRRPLTYVSEDPQDLEPLTPAMFLHPFGGVQFPEKELTEAEKMRFRWNYVNTLKEELKKRFTKEYLSMLVSKNREKATRCLKVGELVLVGNDSTKRINWPLGRILQLVEGTDGGKRMALVKTETGEFLRPFQRLYPLEMDEETEVRKNFQEKIVRTRSGRKVKAPERFK